MPELPEVESIKRILKGCLTGKKIIEIKFYYSGMLGGLAVKEFVKDVQGKQILEVKRWGKYLYFCISGEKVLEAHRV